MSEPSNCIKENCGTFIPKPLIFSQGSLRPSGKLPSIIALDANEIKLIPTIFDTNGVVLEALTFASITYTSSSLRSEERRVGKECRTRWETKHENNRPTR